MIYVVVQESRTTDYRRLLLYKVEPPYTEQLLLQRLEEWNNKGDYLYRILEGVPEELKTLLLEEEERRIQSWREEREDIGDYFRQAENALEELKTMYNQKY